MKKILRLIFSVIGWVLLSPIMVIVYPPFLVICLVQWAFDDGKEGYWEFVNNTERYMSRFD